MLREQAGRKHPAIQQFYLTVLLDYVVDMLTLSEVSSIAIRMRDD